MCEHAIAAALGAALSIALGIVPLDLVQLAIRLLFFPVLTIVSLMVITLIAERAGLFDSARAVHRRRRPAATDGDSSPTSSPAAR